MRRRETVASMIAGAMLVLGLLAVFAVGLTNTQAKSKADVESRVHERSDLAAALIDSLFQTSATSSTATYVRRYGTARVPNRRLEAFKATSSYLVLLGPSGRVIAHSSGFTSQARKDLRISATLHLLRSGRQWALGNVLPYGSRGVVNFGVAIPTRYGTRLLLTGVSPETLGAFLLGELRQIPGVRGSHNFVLDANGVIIASTFAARPSGYRFHTPAQLSILRHSSGEVLNHYYDQVPLKNTSWRILLTAPNGPLFASVSGLRKWLPWIIFAAFALVGLLALWLALGALRASDRVQVANEMLNDANQQLAATNTELAGANEELERRAQELARSNAELDQFASIASHDLQEPLRKVRTFTERVTASDDSVLTEKARDYLNRAGASAERMQHLIDDLLKYSRVATKGHPFTRVDLQQVTGEVLDDLHEAIAASGAVVRVGQLPTISADAPQMRQLLQNLISNGLKFRREGVTPEIDISAISEGDRVKLVVRDNGIGFDPQYAARIFRVFERLHGRSAYPGTGIGLALCRKIAERHGGTVEAESVPGQGSTFTVTMQSQRKEAVSELPPTATGDAPDTQQESYVSV